MKPSESPCVEQDPTHPGFVSLSSLGSRGEKKDNGKGGRDNGETDSHRANEQNSKLLSLHTVGRTTPMSFLGRTPEVVLMEFYTGLVRECCT
jgi:hypothetical protein